MEQITFECETITPMFLAGADGKTAELRPPSIKGAMRFWWRAMNGHLSIEKLKEKEAEIFGGSGEKQGRSKVVIVIKNRNVKKGKNLKKYYDLKWEPDKKNHTIKGTKDKYGNDVDDTGIGYLLYSALLNKEKEFIGDGGTFDIQFKSKNKDDLQQAIAAFWSAIYLGGFGSRSRRGGGNIVVTSIDDPQNLLKQTEIDFIPKGKRPEDVANWILTNFHKAQKIVLEGKNRPDNFINSYSNLAFSRLIICNESKNNWKDALNEIGRLYKKFREENKWQKLKVGAFGLPASRVTVKYSGKEKINRRSSPLIFKVIKTDSGNYFWILLRLSGEFLPEGANLKNRGRQEKASYGLIDEFWREAKSIGWQQKETILSEPEILVTIKDEIVTQINPDKIIFFGSKARGDFHKGADIDLAIEPGNDNSGNLDINGAIDIIDLKANTDENLAKKIKKEGVIIYEREN